MLKELRLFNFCQHKRLTVRFSPGLNGVVGRNGSGKSNLIGALWFILTGESPKAGAKAKCVRQGAKSNERACAELDFSHDQHEYTVVRQIRSAGSIMQRDGVAIASGEVAVTAELLSLLRTDKGQLAHAVFSAQTNLTDLIDATPAVRLTRLQTVYGLLDLEQVRDSLSQECQETARQAPPAGDDPSAREAALAELQTQYDSVVAELAAAMPSEAIDARRMELQRALSDQQERAAAVRKLPEIVQAATAAAAECESHTRQIGEAEAVVADLQALVSAGEAEAQATAAAVAAAEQFTAVRQQTAAKTLELEGVMLQLGSVAPVVPPPNWEPSWAAGDQASLVAEIQSLEKFVRSAEQRHVCPACQRPFEQRVDVTPKLLKIDELRSELSALHSRQAADREYRLAVAAHEAHVRRLIERRAALEESLASLRSVRAVEVTPAARAVVQRHQDVAASLREMQTTLNWLRTMKAKAEGSRDALDQQRRAVETAIAGIPEYDVAPLNAEMAALWNAAGRLTELTGQRDRLRNEIAAGRQFLANAREQYRKAKAADAWISFLQNVREVFGKNGAMQVLLVSNMRQVQAAVNASLGLFVVDFRLAVGDDLDLTAEFTDGRKVGIAELSRGQKTVLGVSLWIALHFMLAPHVPLLVMDEPTQFLDEENLRAFRPVIDRLRSFSNANDMQVIIVTHEQSLSSHFDNLIVMGNGDA